MHNQDENNLPIPNKQNDYGLWSQAFPFSRALESFCVILTFPQYPCKPVNILKVGVARENK